MTDANVPTLTETAKTQVAIPEGPGALLTAIMQMARDPAVDVVKLQAVLAMQERLEDRQAERMFNEALHAAQSEVPAVAKNGTVALGQGKGSYKFATLFDLDAALRPIMEKHGFSVSVDFSERAGGGAIATGTLRHVAGHSKSISIPLPLDAGPGRNNLQAMGSTASYARRYLLEMHFNVVRRDLSDDDGVWGGTAFISKDQVEELIALMKETKTQEGRFLDVMVSDARNIEEVREKDFPRLLNALRQKQHAQKTAGRGVSE